MKRDGVLRGRVVIKTREISIATGFIRLDKVSK